MKLVCRQSQILSHIQELGNSMRRDPRDVIIPFFRRIEEPEYLKEFLKAVDQFAEKIVKRAVDKRKEMDEENAKNRTVGPGGLDPMEVLESLPSELRNAFESRDINAFRSVFASMNSADAAYYLKRCVDSGLWVPNNDSSLDDEGEEGDEEDGEEVGSEVEEVGSEVQGEN
jgi:cell division cycle protein 37